MSKGMCPRMGRLCAVSIFCAFSGIQDASCVSEPAPPQDLERNHPGVAARYLQEGRWQEALSQAEQGVASAPQIADFLFIAARASYALRQPRARALQWMARAVAKDMQWCVYDIEEVRLFYARLCVDTLQHARALELLATAEQVSADADWLRARARYGLGQVEHAQELIEKALERWALDARFAKLFFAQERSRRPSSRSKKIADSILSRLSVWQEQDPSLLVEAALFEPRTNMAFRYLQTYFTLRPLDAPGESSAQSSYEQSTRAGDSAPEQELYARAQSIVLGLQYGVLDEQRAMEMFCTLNSPLAVPAVDPTDDVSSFGVHASSVSSSTPLQRVVVLYADLLHEFSRLLASRPIRARFVRFLAEFEGVLYTDENRDGIVSARVFFKAGRPRRAQFDTNQDGILEYEVYANDGAPTCVHTMHSTQKTELSRASVFPIPQNIAAHDHERAAERWIAPRVSLPADNGVEGETQAHVPLTQQGYRVCYDRYPEVHQVGWEDKTYVLRPRALRWQPVRMQSLDLARDLEGVRSHDFFTMILTNEPLPTEQQITVSSLYYEKPDSLFERARVRTYLDEGLPLFSETHVGSRFRARTHYVDGRATRRDSDRDDDGFFETREYYNAQGAVRALSVDVHKDRSFAYQEEYGAKGQKVQKWYGRGRVTISHTELPTGHARTEWLHPVTGRHVTVDFVQGVPKRLLVDGEVHTLTKDPRNAALYWVRRIPRNGDEVGQRIVESFRAATSPVVSEYFRTGGSVVRAVRSGGVVFAEELEPGKE
nr:tetratricopeptide repeat protein [Treponema paraluiscuniculi]